MSSVPQPDNVPNLSGPTVGSTSGAYARPGFRGAVLSAGLIIILPLLVAGCGRALGQSPIERLPGATASLGDGSVSGYADIDANDVPTAIGLAFSAAALATLPTEHSDGHRCFDANGDGTIDPGTECSPWHERVIPLPTRVSRRSEMPFKWVLLNWNPHGHIPPGVWNVPHFDVHFYLEPIENIFALQRGSCGPEHLRCDQFALATKPLPANYIPPDFVNVDAAAPAMGNHLIDPSGPEFHGRGFTRSWIYGAYDGRVIFYEEMVTRVYLLSQPNSCAPIKSPAAVAVAGYYPRSSCIRFDAIAGVYTVSLEDFIFREAAPPAPIQAGKSGS